jgi:hypothetical protein
MTDTHTDDFLDVEPCAAAPAAEEVSGGAPSRRKAPAALVTAGWLVAGLAAGAAGVAIWESHSTAASGSPAAATGNLPGGGQGVAPNGAAGGPNGVPNGGPGGFGGGPMAGEQHLSGTLSSVSASTFGLTTSTGTTTYTIDSSTMLIVNGQRVSSLSSMHAGDQVVVHVYPGNGSPHVEMVVDGQ